MERRGSAQRFCEHRFAVAQSILRSLLSSYAESVTKRPGRSRWLPSSSMIEPETHKTTSPADGRLTYLIDRMSWLPARHRIPVTVPFHQWSDYSKGSSQPKPPSSRSLRVATAHTSELSSRLPSNDRHGSVIEAHALLPAGLQQADNILLDDRAAAVPLSLRPSAASLRDFERTEV